MSITLNVSTPVKTVRQVSSLHFCFKPETYIFRTQSLPPLATLCPSGLQSTANTCRGDMTETHSPSHTLSLSLSLSHTHTHTHTHTSALSHIHTLSPSPSLPLSLTPPHPPPQPHPPTRTNCLTSTLIHPRPPLPPDPLHTHTHCLTYTRDKKLVTHVESQASARRERRVALYKKSPSSYHYNYVSPTSEDI